MNKPRKPKENEPCLWGSQRHYPLIRIAFTGDAPAETDNEGEDADFQ